MLLAHPVFQETRQLRSVNFSILLIVKNALPLVKGTLQSLRSQTFKNFEVVVVDGASTDGTLDALNQAAKDLPLRIVSEPDRSLADGFAKGLGRATGDIVGMLCADERYYPETLQQVAEWFAADPDAVMCGGKVDFIDERDSVVGSHLTAPFNLPAHLACELVPSNLSSFFNRPLIGDDFRFDAEVPTCPDYEYWARLGFRFPASAFKRYDVNIAQAYRTRDSMSFRAESFTQFARDKLLHLNKVLAREYAGSAREAVRQRSSAGIHMWAAEQLSGIELGHPDIFAHCAAAARYDRTYQRIAGFLAAYNRVRYHAATGTIRRNDPGPRTSAVAQYECDAPPQHGAAILRRDPLTIETANAPWGFSVVMHLPNAERIRESLNGGQYWARVDLEVVAGSIGIGMYTPEHTILSEKVLNPRDGRAVALFPLTPEIYPMLPLMLRSGGQPSSVLRVYRAQLLRDPDSNAVEPIDITDRITASR
jgi:glycosyltransferase involved in cell wall biosynthesis